MKALMIWMKNNENDLTSAFVTGMILNGRGFIPIAGPIIAVMQAARLDERIAIQWWMEGERLGYLYIENGKPVGARNWVGPKHMIERDESWSLPL